MKFKRLICLVLTIVLSFSVLSSHNYANAYVAHTQSEAIAWAKSKVGTFVNYDGAYGAQCVDMTMAYYNYLGVPVFYGNAIDYASNGGATPTGWKRIVYSNGFIAQPGDIAVFKYGTYGHIGIVISANSSSMSIIHNRNLNGNGVENARNDSYKYTDMNFYCVIRPDFVTCTHSYTSSSPYVCTKCNEWKTNSLKSSKNLSNVQYVITKDGAIDHTGPYGECKTVNKYSKNTIITTVQEVVNAHGSTWYKLSNGNYIWGDYVKKYSVSYTSIAEGTYYLKNVANGTVMSVAYNEDVNKQRVNLWENTAQSGMKMVIKKTTTGYKIRPSLCSSRLINPNAESVSHGNDINIYNDVNDSSQWWQFEKVGSYYVIHNVQNPSCVLDAPNGVHSGVFAMNYTGANSQKWVLEPVNAPATYMLDVNGNIDYKTDMGTTAGYGTFDVYINGKLVADDVTDYCQYHPAGTTYQIKDVKTVNGKCFRSVSSGSASGTVSSNTVKITLTFSSTHNFNDGQITTPASCSADGVKTYVCKSCTYSKTESIPATGYHSLVLVVDFPASCSSGGIRVYECSYCSEQMEERFDRLPHSYVTSTYAATCTEDGYILKTCTVCGHEDNQITSSALGHDMYLAEEKLATCESSGHILHKCRRCDESQMVILDTFGHRWDDGVQTKAPTATETGLLTFTCLECGETKTETIAAAEYIPGDVNLDGKITAADARLALRAAAKLDKLTGIPFAAADMNKDNEIKASDARLILRKSAKLD